MHHHRKKGPSRPNVIWITLDSLRADHTTMQGYDRDTTPHLNRIATDSGGQFIDECISHGRYTLMSSASILSGLYPSRHRVGLDRGRLPDATTTIAERFRDHGYHTACLTRNPLAGSATGVDRGFDRFELLYPRSLLRVAGPITVAKYLRNIRRHSVGFETDLRQHATAYLMTAVAENWIDSFADEAEPFFLYVHYNEPHRPYCPPLPYRRAFAEDIELSASEAAATAMRVHDNLVEIVANGCDLSDAEWEALIAMYDAEIAYTDACVGRLFDAIQRSTLGETIVVITADHGEFFGEHGFLAHKYAMDDAVLAVPLVTHGLAGPANENAPVQHTDVMTGLLRTAGADTTGVQGIDYREEKREYTISQDNAISPESLLEYNPDFDVSRLTIGESSVIRRCGFKLEKSAAGRTLYRLPDETTDVADRHPEIADRLDRTLSEWLRTEGRPIERDEAGEANNGEGDSGEAELTDAMRRQLADLGYLDDEIPD